MTFTAPDWTLVFEGLSFMPVSPDMVMLAFEVTREQRQQVKLEALRRGQTVRAACVELLRQAGYLSALPEAEDEQGGRVKVAVDA